MALLTLLFSAFLWPCLVLAQPSNTTTTLSVVGALVSATSDSSAGSPTGTFVASAVSSPTSSLSDTTVPSTTTFSTSTFVSSPNGTTTTPPTSTVTTNSTANTTASPAPTTNTSDPDIAIMGPRRVEFAISQQSGAKSIPDWLSTLGADGKWPDSEVDYTSGCGAQRANWPAQKHWSRIGALAAAWHGGFSGAASSYIKSEALREQISLALDWWFDRDFTVLSCLDNGGTASCPCDTPGLWNTNWFSNVILIPRLVGQTCLMLHESLTPTQFSNCTYMTSRTYSIFQRVEPSDRLAGANLLDISSIGIANGVLTSNSELVADAYARVHGEVSVKTGFQVDGILGDGSFGQHGGLLYNGNYGKDYSNDVLELEIEAGGTRFAAPGDSKSAFEKLVNASQWMIYQNTLTGVLHWDFSTEGRFISFPVIDKQATSSIKINLTEVEHLSELWESTVLRSVYNGLTTNTSTANVGRLEGNRMFWDNDYMITRGRNYVSTLKMYSTRTRNTEYINLQNPSGFHLADGTTYTYIKGDEYEDISAAWDWNLIPGTTVDYDATPLVGSTENTAGVESFVGGVSTGKLGAAVMRYTNPLTGSLTFQKTWFYFENDVQHVMVSVLDSQTNASVFSVLDQRTHRGPIYVDAIPVSSGNFSYPQTLFHADTGYLFEDASSVSISAGERTGDWTAIGTSKQPAETVDLFAAWIPHDPDEQNNSVSYTVFPGRNRWDFYSEAYGSPLRTLNKDTSVSAVQDRAHGTIMMAFWQPEGGTVRIPASGEWGSGGVVSVTSDSALAAIFDQERWVVTVADPTQLLGSAQLTFEVRGARERPWGWGRSSTKTVQIVFPAAPSAGSSVSQSVLH